MDFSLSNLMWLAVKIVIASYVLRWAWTEVVSDWFHRGFKLPHFNFRRELPPAPPQVRRRIATTEEMNPFRDPKKKSRKRVQLKEEKVFHAKSVDGRDQIVMASDEDESNEIGAKAMGVKKEDVVSAEVYDKVIRK